VTTFFDFVNCGGVDYGAVQSERLYSERLTHVSFIATRQEKLGRSSGTHVISLRFRLSCDRTVQKSLLKLLIVNLLVATSLLALQTLSQ
jgi:hypothetical protein